MPSYNVATQNRFAFVDSEDESPKKVAAPKKEEVKAAPIPGTAEAAKKPAGDRPPRDGARGRGRGGRFGDRPVQSENPGDNGENHRREDRPRRGRGGPRLHDREDRTGMKDGIKKEGGGAHNWGNQAEDYGAEGGDRYGDRPRRGRGGARGGRGGRRFEGERKEGEEKKEEVKEEGAEETKAEGAEGEKVEETEQKEEKKEEEKGPEMQDYEAFKKAQAAKRANLPTIAAKVEVADPAKALKGYSKHEKKDGEEKIFISTKHVKGTAHEGKEEESSSEDETKPKKKVMNFFEFAAESGANVKLLPREDRRDDRRGGRGGRGRGGERPARGPRGPRGGAAAPHLEDNSAFPTLGGK